MTDKELASQIIALAGTQSNIESVAHCATRLRLIVKDKDNIDTDAIENLDRVKGSFFNSGQYQIILGTGLVNRIYDEVVSITGITDASSKKEDTAGGKQEYGNWFQRAIRMFADVFTHYSRTCRYRSFHGASRTSHTACSSELIKMLHSFSHRYRSF